MNRVAKFKRVSERMAILKLNSGEKRMLSIVQVCAPTNIALESRTEEFYNQLVSLIESKKRNYTVVMGDRNTKIGTDSPLSKSLGKYRMWVSNENRNRLAQFALENNLKIINTFFIKQLRTVPD